MAAEASSISKEEVLTEAANQKKASPTNKVSEKVLSEVEAEIPVVKEHKYARPTGGLNTDSISIKETLEPKKKSLQTEEGENLKPKRDEDFSFDELNTLWKEYALRVKRENRDLLYSTMTSSELILSSDYQITLDIVNKIQSIELEREKSELVGFLRSRLKNDFINLKTNLTEAPTISVADTKSTFDKLAEENNSLNKFRKLFNLDIEF